MLKCNFLSTTLDGQELCGYLLLEGDTVKAFPGPGTDNKILFKTLMSPTEPKEAKLKEKDPKKWMRSLPMKYSGAYLRCELVEST